MTNEEMIAELNQLLVAVQKAMPPHLVTICREAREINGIMLARNEVDDFMKCDAVWSQRWRQ